MYLNLLHSKDEAFDAFKLFKAEVENICGKRIKIVRSDRSGEYYGRYIENGQAPGPFAKFFQDHGIVAQCTMPGSPDQNGVAERRNRTLIEMDIVLERDHHEVPPSDSSDRRSAIPDDYEVYLQELDYNVGADNDPMSFSQAVSSTESNLWMNAMKDEMNSMASNGVWDLVVLPDDVKPIGCKWVYKTKRDSLGNIERHKARLVAKGFTQREGIDYT
ncbi:uncharacterized protein LOC141631153 [Silene latifolia]|uniref:uncharacterized protein LOC141631153 n=1 Tax=Silene latifolia TaxID=37657 RepID=UPI003D781777